MLLNKTLQKVMDSTIKQLCSLGKTEWAKLFANCFPNTWETTLKVMPDGSTFLITGDIAAMWLRDSAGQVNHYLPYASEDEEIYQRVVGIIQRHALYVLKDPYANSYNEAANNLGFVNDITERSPWVWERKYEVDSLCSVIALPYKLYRQTGKTEFFDGQLKAAFEKILSVWETEQYHKEKSTYTFVRITNREVDTLPNDGKGNPVGYTGMTWSGFRPSDDRCIYNYLIPSEMYAVVVLKYLVEIFSEIYQDLEAAKRAEKLWKQIDQGIKEFAVYNHSKYGEIFAYEVDGLGNRLLMDDANSPSLLSAPYIGYCNKEDPIYKNTRQFILSADNPYYYQGTVLTGVGSPHNTRSGGVWPLSLCMQGLTSDDIEEIENILEMLSNSHDGTYYMHESIQSNDASVYTRSWFAWANSLYSELVLKYLAMKDTGIGGV